MAAGWDFERCAKAVATEMGSSSENKKQALTTV